MHPETRVFLLHSVLRKRSRVTYRLLPLVKESFVKIRICVLIVTFQTYKKVYFNFTTVDGNAISFSSNNFECSLGLQ